jgi:hypothetical protein
MSHTHTTFNGFPLHIQRVPLWQASIILTGAVVVAATLAVLAGGLFLLLLPVFAVGAVTYRVVGRPRAGRRRENAPHPESDIIEGEFVVLSHEPAKEPKEK